jgi:hypothetical protein
LKTKGTGTFFGDHDSLENNEFLAEK